MSLYEDPEQRMSRRHRFAEVVVVVDRQQIAVDISVADHHLHIGDAVNVKYELVKLLKLSGFETVHREPAKFCPILSRKKKTGSQEGQLQGQLNRKRKPGMSDLMYLSEPSDWHT